MFSKQALFGFVLAAFAVFSLSLPAYAAKPVKKELPAAIASAFAKDYPNAKILNWSAEKEDGVLSYEVESMDGATRRDLVYSPEGKALEIEERIQPADLPQAVSLSISKAYPKGVVKSAEKLTRGDFTGYEVAVKVGKKSHEVVLDTAGAIQKAPKEGGEKD